MCPPVFTLSLHDGYLLLMYTRKKFVQHCCKQAHCSTCLQAIGQLAAACIVTRSCLPISCTSRNRCLAYSIMMVLSHRLGEPSQFERASRSQPSPADFSTYKTELVEALARYLQVCSRLAKEGKRTMYIPTCENGSIQSRPLPSMPCPWACHSVHHRCRSLLQAGCRHYLI